MNSMITSFGGYSKIRARTRIRPQYVERRVPVNSLFECEQACLNEREFNCRSFNFM